MRYQIIRFTLHVLKNNMFRRYLTFVIIFLTFVSQVRATHNRAGEITYRQISNLLYEAKIVVYTKTSSNIDRPYLTLFWGDGSNDSLPRVNQTVVAADITRNTYIGTHSYPAPATYTMYFEDQNRNGNVLNIPNSVNTAFFVQSQLTINPFLGPNNSPILLNPPIDYGFALQTFVHNANAYDPDGDSLSYELFVCKGDFGQSCPGYYFPIGTISFTLDSVNGNLIWDTPRNIDQGEWNVAFLIKEWRNGVNIGYVERDMQIEILPPINNKPPVIIALNDTCVLAGSNITFDVTAVDPDTDNVTLSATGGPFQFSPDSATFPQPSTGTGTVTVQFSWNTTCKHTRGNAYEVLFKAIDEFNNPVPPPNMLNHVVFHITNIRVVAPRPENPTAVPLGNSITVGWDKEICDSAKGYHIYRRSGFYGFTPSQCETGVPAYTGYTRIATISSINTLSYTDNNNGSGLIPGNDYCYMITAFFKDSSESYASEEICAQLKHDLPVITNVSIEQTNISTGKAYIAWSKPTELDTNQTPGPFLYILFRSNDYTGNSFAVVDTFFNLNDTTYFDSGINTVNAPWSYKVDFWNITPGNVFKIGATQTASSVFQTPSPTDRAVLLTWSEIVPWSNTEYVICRKNGLGIFDSIGVSISQSFVDSGLTNGTEYCYKIKSIGAYSGGGFVNPILNYSQEVCTTPFDNVPPCIPLLTVTADCNKKQNGLSWHFPDASCPDDILQFNIYYAANTQDDPQLIGTVYYPDTVFIHDSLMSIAGCYTITAVDTVGNESEFSEKLCVDNCPNYELPNVFTPNNDGINDTFHPFPYSFVKNVDIIIYDRWGLKMYSTTNPEIGRAHV